MLVAAAAAPPYAGLPDEAVVLEEQVLPVWAHRDRALVLWVIGPADKPLHGRTLLDETDASPEEDYDYTCPEQTTGHFYRAPARVSLVDTAGKRVLNTVRVQLSARDEYDVPFRIRPGYPYAVSGPLVKGAGKPHILSLKDFNGDGKALEFAFYVMESCNGPLTMVMGYSERRDQVMIYEFLLQDKAAERQATPQTWMYRFTAHKPIGTMHWQYDEWYNSGAHEEWDFRYIPERETFVGSTVITSGSTNLRGRQKKR